MNVKKIAGIILLISGIAMILFSVYITNQVAEGKAKISNAQNTVDKGSSLFSTNPISKQIGKVFMNSAQSQIDAGQSQIVYYEGLSGWLLVGGIGFIVLGGSALLFLRKQ